MVQNSAFKRGALNDLIYLAGAVDPSNNTHYLFYGGNNIGKHGQNSVGLKFIGV